MAIVLRTSTPVPEDIPFRTLLRRVDAIDEYFKKKAEQKGK